MKPNCVLMNRLPEKAESLSWCGRTLHSYEWYFLDANHVANTGIDGMSGIAACETCISKIKKALDNTL